MKATEFRSRIALLPKACDVCDGELERTNIWFGRRVPSIFIYSYACERMFEQYLESVGKKREWTWYADLSTAEWCESCGDNGAVKDTCANALKYWSKDEKCMAEFACSVAMKANEHAERGHRQWCIYYSALFEYIRDFIYEVYENDEEKTGYFWRYLD